MGAAGLLLTGGTSRRMGRPKAAIAPGEDGATLAERCASVLSAHTSPTLEIGPGFSSLPNIVEDPPGGGPLVALAAGATALAHRRWEGPAVVIATDMPMLDGRLVAWLVEHPARRSVVPVVGGVPQYLCARYERTALETAIAAVGAGTRSMREFLASIDHELPGPESWSAAGIDARWFADIDTPEDLAHVTPAEVTAAPPGPAR